MRMKVFVLVSLVLVFLAGSVFAEDHDPVVGKTGDYVIRKSDLDRLVTYYGPERQQFLEKNPQQQVTLVKRMLQVKVLSDLARKEGLEKKPETVEQIKYLTNEFLAKEYISQISKDVTVTDDAVTQYYTAHKEMFTVPARVRARHILIRVAKTASDADRKKALEKAQEILEKAKKGEDFAKLAEEYSEDKGSRERGGDLGYFSRGTMEKPFEEAAFALKKGEISDVVETKYGYHIIKVEDSEEARLRPLSEVKDYVREHVRNDLMKTRAVDYLEKAEKDAGVEIFPDVITGKTETK